MGRLLVTGATGFLGGHFVRAARAAGHHVIALSRRPSPDLDEIVDESLIADVRRLTPASIPEDVDAIVHFAATQGPAPEVVSVAVDGTANMLECASRAGIPHFLHVSSMSVYPGNSQATGGRADLSALEPWPERRGTYAHSKTLAERAVIEWASASNGDHPAVTIVRPGLVFGRQMQSPLAGSGIAGPFGLVVALGRRGQRVAVTHITDVSAALIGLIDQPPEPGAVRAFDILSGDPPTKKAFLEAYARMTGQPTRPVWIPGRALRGAARGIDTVSRLRKAPGSIDYAVRRMYEFDPGGLPYDVIWTHLGARPAEGLESSLRAALTIDRAGIDDEAAGLQTARLREQAERVLSAESSTGGEGGAAGTPLVLIGGGRVIADLHLPALRAMPNHPVVAVVDASLPVAQAMAGRLAGAVALQSLDDIEPDLLARAAVIIATPGFTHAELAVEALERAGSLLIEKPVSLTADEFASIRKAASKQDKRVSVFQNYRARPNVLRLWRHVLAHDLGAIVRARVEFHSGRLETESTRWTLDEKALRVLPMELAIHFVDLACLAGGPVERFDHVAVTDDRYTGATASLSAIGRSTSGAVMEFDMSLTGRARRVCVDLEFERATAQLSFYPEGFRILPVRRTPLDDGAASLDEFSRFAWSSLRRRLLGGADRGGPHARVYGSHFQSLSNEHESPFSLLSVDSTMTTLFALCAEAYPPR